MTKFLLSLGVAAAALVAVPAQAADFSFVGTTNDPGQVLTFDFTVGSQSTVTLRSLGYAGGVNAQGVTIAQGGFDPILGLYDFVTGNLIAENDDGGFNVAADPSTGRRYDSYLQANLGAGRYIAAVGVFPNFNSGNLYTGTFGGATSYSGRTNAFAFDVLGVAAAVGPGGAVPEPAAWALMIGGFGMVGGAMRSRRNTSVRFAV